MSTFVSVHTPPYPQKTAHTYHWGRLYGASNALAITNLAQERTGLVVVIANTISQAITLEEQILCFTDTVSVMHFPHWETLPYDQISPHQDIVSKRLETLQQLPNLHQGILIVTVPTLLQKLPPQSYITNNSLAFHAGQKFDFSALIRQLERSGYHRVQQVMEHGEFSVRGEIIDLFPMGQTLPLRLDFFDDEIESIKSFDPQTQRSTDSHDHINILPARELPLDTETIQRFKKNWVQQFPEHIDSVIYQSIEKQLSPAGIEYYLPMFFDTTSTLFDYFADDTLILSTDGLDTTINQVFQEYQERYQHSENPVLSPETLILREDECFAAIKPLAHIKTNVFENSSSKAGVHNFATHKIPVLTIDHKQEEPLHLLLAFMQTFQERILFVAESPGRREVLKTMLLARKISLPDYENYQQFMHSNTDYGIIVGSLDLAIHTEALCIITETQLFGSHIKQRRKSKQSAKQHEAAIHSLIELKLNDPVVHVDNGVGRYRGLKTLDAGGQTAEYLVLEYAKQDILYVPVDALNLIHRYTGADADHAPIHRLGSGQWDKAKRKAKEKAHDIAAELLEIYAKREAATGKGILPLDEQYQIFASEFPFEPTFDQQKAIDDTIEDMQRPAPMDRLICGDVGFGKTEVAMRAAFLAAQNNRQTAVLVPTTLLAQQHYKSFIDRFAEWPIHIEVLSRFQTPAQSKASLKKIQDGTADIIIGTHKLLSKDVIFDRLGLLVIDEEHRFGVKQKEKFKSLRAEIDILTLTATPIPRTLNLSISGMRDLSIIATAPNNRVAIKTFVEAWDEEKIKEACYREISRGGQVYFLHNRVEDIDKVARELSTLLPEAEIGVAHGQMNEHELEDVMHDFYHRKVHILVCTTIIETGIDIPNANTIIINRADKLGLAQLYQIRGRVGRSHHRAYAYLVIPDHASLSDNARKRLEAIESLEDLGLGFTLALQDMEIRGTGEILGEGQSGQITEVGFSMYSEILEQAVHDLKSTDQTPIHKPAAIEISLGHPALLPESYMPDINQRLVFYKRIASAGTDTDLDDLQIELIDRFGLLPDYTNNLFEISSLKLFIGAVGIEKIAGDGEEINIAFTKQPDIDPSKLIQTIQSLPQTYQLLGQDKLKIKGIFLDCLAQTQAIREGITRIQKT